MPWLSLQSNQQANFDIKGRMAVETKNPNLFLNLQK